MKEEVSMIAYYVISCRGFIGSKYYATYEDAHNAAALRRAISGQPWEVKQICVISKWLEYSNHFFYTIILIP